MSTDQEYREWLTSQFYSTNPPFYSTSSVLSERWSPVYDSICLFTLTGHTYTFRNVSIQTDNETVLVFTYTAASDGNTKVGTFFKANLAGYSTCAGVTTGVKTSGAAPVSWPPPWLEPAS